MIFLLIKDVPNYKEKLEEILEITGLTGKRKSKPSQITFLQVTHSPDTAEYGDRIIRLDSGKLVG